jgi:hypothetical protein
MLLVGRPEVKRPAEGPRRRYEDNIETNVRELLWSGTNWSDLPQEIHIAFT